MVQDSPLLCDQIKSLTSSINMLQRRLIKSEGRTMKTRVNNLPPIQKFVKKRVQSKVDGRGSKWTVFRINVHGAPEHFVRPILSLWIVHFRAGSKLMRP